MPETGAAATYVFFGRAIIFAAISADLIRLIPVVHPFGGACHLISIPAARAKAT